MRIVLQPLCFQDGRGAGPERSVRTRFSHCGLALPERFRQFSVGDQLGNPAEVIRQNAVFFDGGRDGANGVVRLLGALSGLEGGAEIERLRHCQRFQRKHVAGVVGDAQQLVGRGHSHGHKIFLVA